MDEEKVDTSKMDHVINLITSLQAQNNTIVTQNNEISNELKEFKLIIHSQIQEIRENNSVMKSDIEEIIKTQGFQSKQFDSHNSVQTTILKSHAKMEKVNQKLMDQVAILEKELEKVKSYKNHMENNSRKITLEISGIPVTKNENCKHIVFDIGMAMGFKELQYNDIDVAHRLMSDETTDRIPSIIVKFISRTSRDNYYSYRAGLKDITILDLKLSETPATKKVKNKIYINESLSLDTKLLFKKARKQAEDFDYKHCYVYGSIIYIKKDKDSQKIRINSEKDFKKLSK